MTKGRISDPQDLDDSGVAEEWQHPLDGGGRDDQHHLQRGPGVKAGLHSQGEPAEDHQDQPLGFEPDLGGPVEERDQAVSVGPEGRPTDGERGGAGLRSLQAAHAEQQVREVADQDQQRRLAEGEAEGHQHDPVHQVLEVDAGASPHAEQVAGSGPPLPARDVLDAALLDPEGLGGSGGVLDYGGGGSGHAGVPSPSPRPTFTNSAASPT